MEPLCNDTTYDLAIILGEIERHLAEDTDLLEKLQNMGFDLSKEIDGYESVIEKLNYLTQLTTHSIEHQERT
ncbi:hypothetical protein [Enterovibrio norvegicus]|uniref:hypothetical protein n=1 Tax=Enterovibrio norvegicus TaxID=188144 RepID=UPI000C8578C4|nr:hypothetical protein [Enterovibrio norvegicus]PMH64554.1 hypothetical protein BCU62_15985 [Enterovibrio norvegicus]